MNKSIMGRRWFGALAASLALSVTALLGGCAAPQATAIDNELPFEQAVLQATEGLVAQTQQLPAFLAKLETKIAKRGVVLDNMIDADSGQQTGVTRLLEQRVTSHTTTKYDLFEILPFQGPNLQKAQYLLTGTMNRIPGSRSKKSFRLNLALTELRTGKVVAQASAISRDDGLDTNPTPYYRDSPVLVKDKVIEGYIRTTATAPGQQADRVYLERIATSALVSDATTCTTASVTAMPWRSTRTPCPPRRVSNCACSTASTCPTSSWAARPMPRRPSRAWWPSGWPTTC